MTAAKNKSLEAEFVRGLLQTRRAPLFEQIAQLERRAASSEVVIEQDEERSAPQGAEVGLSLGHAHAALIDEFLTELCAVAWQEAGAEDAEVSLAGVGSYGRGVLAVGADLDLRILAHDLKVAERIAEALLYPLWDSGIPVGHQVVTIEDLVTTARVDLPTATSLLDWRHIDGDPKLCETLLSKARAALFAPSVLLAFLDRLDVTVSKRHGRFGGSVYLLEPDVKNGLGALRDLDVATWAARARWGVSRIDELVRIGVLVTGQLEAVAQARELLWRIRNILHHQAGRRSDRLSFEQQEYIAPLLGYSGEVGHAVEHMMSDYYRAARTISRFRDLIMARATPKLKLRRPVPRDLGGAVVAFDGQVTLSSIDHIEHEPAIVFRLVKAAVEHRMPLRPSIRNAVINACGDSSWVEALRASAVASRLFIELLCCCADTELKAGSVMRELHDLGLLLAMIPEFLPVVGRVHHDTYHVYTVDVHSVAAVDRLVEIIRGEVVVDEQEGDRWVGSLACRLASEISRPKVLFLATLLHDVGKAIGGRQHSERGARMARSILGRMAEASVADEGEPLLLTEDIDDVARLIEHHLTMYLTATRRDLDDPQTVAEFSRVVGGRDGLHNLYLLTVSDLSTTSPTSMTSWKARMLDELYIATDMYFRDGAPQHEALLARRRSRSLQALADDSDLSEAERAGATAFLEAYLDSMPQRYTLANSPEAIVSHAELARKHLSGDLEATVEFVPSRHPDVAEICVVAEDRLGLLASIAAGLTANRLVVHGAQIFSCDCPTDDETGVSLAVDLFWVRHVAEGMPGVERAVARLSTDLCEVLSGRLDADALAARHRRYLKTEPRGPRVRSKVIVDNRASPQNTVVEVITRDRPGLLFSLAEAIYELNLSIAVAKIATEGTRVADVFYVHERDGGKLITEQRINELKSTLMALIEGMGD